MTGKMVREASAEKAYEAIIEVARRGLPSEMSIVERWLEENEGNPHWEEVGETYFFHSEYDEKIRKGNEAWLRNPKNWNSEGFGELFKDTFGFTLRVSPVEFFGGAA